MWGSLIVLTFFLKVMQWTGFLIPDDEPPAAVSPITGKPVRTFVMITRETYPPGTKYQAPAAKPPKDDLEDEP